MNSIESWGRLYKDQDDVKWLSDPQHVSSQIYFNTEKSGLPYGLGKSYGDSCLNPGNSLWVTQGLNCLKHFDPSTGILVCEPGVMLSDIQALMQPLYWCLPVVPGTELITVGGAIANDIHGKNHHIHGNFGHHVIGLKLARTDGTQLWCDHHENSELFKATIGGVGLTGLIIEAKLQLMRVSGPMVEAERLRFNSLEEFFSIADLSESAWEHTVAWVDVSSANMRGIFLRGNASPLLDGESLPKNFPKALPFSFPVSAMNRLTLQPLNWLYFTTQVAKLGKFRSPRKSFLHPLDHLLHWNRAYGPRGFFQYQCVLPRSVGLEALHTILNEMRIKKLGSLLTVLKTFGEMASVGMLSFPEPGVTLAVDFPNTGSDILNFMERLDKIVIEAGGKLYLAKDARQSRAMFEKTYPQFELFQQYRDPGISSGLSRRLMGW
jgi:FAD/FMN-containing dehydrogenase